MSTLSIPGYVVTLDSYQWGYVGGTQYGERNVVVSDYGVLHRERTGTVQRLQRVRFAQIDSKLEALRTLTIRAGRRALPVTFTPDEVNAPGTSWTVDWPDADTFKQALDNFREVDVDLLEQSPGV